MANSRIIATRRQVVFMAHVCSECGFPIITVVQIEAEAEKTYAFSPAKAEQIANETAKNAITEEIQKIEACYQTKQPLVSKQKESNMIAPGHFCTLSCSGFASYCPKCLNIEPWKSAVSKKKMDELEQDNFPIVFENADEAKTWAFDKVKAMVAAINAKRQEPFSIERATIEVKDEKTNILIRTHQMNTLQEQSTYERLKEELAAAENQKTCLGCLDFKAKKNISEKIKVLESQIKSGKDALDRKREPIAKQIITTQNKLLTTQAIAFGSTDDILSTKNGNSFAFFFSPNKIPADIMVEIENYVQETLNGHQDSCTINTTSNIDSKYSNEVIYCRKCGFKLLPDSTFCTKCGSKIN